MMKPKHWIIFIIMATAILIAGAGKWCCQLGPAHGAEPTRQEPAHNHAAELDRYVDWFHNNDKSSMKPRYARKAKELIPPLLKYCEQYDVDPLLAAIIISHESSWRHFEGAMGEKGAFHVMPSKWSRQYDMSTVDGGIHAGVARLRLAIDKCGSLRGAICHFASGACTARTDKTRGLVTLRVKRYQKAIQRFREGDQ